MALEAAAAIVAESGQAGLSGRKVAGAIGYTVGTLYTLFSNIDDLIAHLNTETMGELVAAMEAAGQGDSDPEQRLLAIAHAYAGYAQANPQRWRLVFDHRLPPGQPPPDLMQTRRRRILGLVGQSLKPLLDDGTDLATAGAAIWSAVHGVCYLALTGKLELVPGERGIEQLIEHLIHSYLAGLRR